MKNNLKKIIIIMGLILIFISIITGILITVFSIKLLNGTWLFSQYILTVIGLGISGFFIGILGIILIYACIKGN